MENCVNLQKNPKQNVLVLYWLKKFQRKKKKMLPEMPEINNGRP